MSYSIPINGYPHGDPLNSYTDREAREERYQVAREKRERLGEAGVGREGGNGGRTLRLPLEEELSQDLSERAIDLPTEAELERAAKESARVGEFRDWLSAKAEELGLNRK